jgi:hypothetical protein
MGEWVYRSTYSSPRHWLEVSGQLHTPAALPPRKKILSTHWLEGRVGPRTNLEDIGRRKFCPYREWNSDPSVVQYVASLYTDCAILAPGGRD